MTRRSLVTALLVLAVVALVAVPLVAASGDFGGTDGAATEAIEAEGYTPWFDSVFSPSGEVESGLFALQAALGAGVLGYVLGRLHGRRQAARTPAATAAPDDGPR
ncbi:energy-coupling factor ABC transporter substrate-binding protein [Geodermatophilus sp. YIM 151500]|uniref:energy-coupling factor ABC transporter substrate-binding protein n=1 Tax=Geodermatophilus sp. YIM 151500 TaxID=2984531 RepID=UPI0021E51406|nr:energy-coupling factor ABC transporter substrate-binding protein [Geodermatophilus sp. YIM 151500]MCV2491017.1 energy-coupling factor ABC transporter substrate-binding protein [Geodermatophilus sp. YIM 151500]